MDITNMFPGKYRKAQDFDEPTVLTMRVVYKERVGNEQEEKPVLYFDDDDPRGVVLNKTNAMTLASLYGKDTKEWKGKEVEVYPTQVPFGSQIVDSIRMRKPGGLFGDLEDVPDLAS